MRPIIIFALATLLATAAHAQGTFYRSASGKWQPLKTTTSGAVTKFSLSPDEVGGGETLIVVNKPAWMVLDDDTPPALVKVLLDNQEKTPGQLDLGQIAAAPSELGFALKDDKNPLDQSVTVLLNGQPLDAKQVTVAKLDKEGKYLRVGVRLGDNLPPAKYTLTATVADLSPARNACTLTLKFSTAPLVANGSFENVDKDNNPIGWSTGSWGSDDPSSYNWTVADGGAVGQKALRVTSTKGGNLTANQQMDALKPETPYVLTGQYKGAGGAGLSIITYDAAGKQLDYLNKSLPASADWAPFSFEFTVKPHERSSVVVRTGAKGETWFDDVKLNLKQ